MKFKIPRYIDYEAKIFGPASFKQFLVLLGGMATIGFLFVVIESFLGFVFSAMVIGGLVLTITFGKIDEQPLVSLIGKYITFRLSGTKTYFWEKKEVYPKAIKMKEMKDVDDEKETKYEVSRKTGRLDKMSKNIELS